MTDKDKPKEPTGEGMCVARYWGARCVKVPGHLPKTHLGYVGATAVRWEPCPHCEAIDGKING